jgi:hypothetical protein
MFVRFVIKHVNAKSGVQAGLFDAVKRLPPIGKVADWDEKRMAEIFEWFHEHLPHPTRVARSRRPNGHPAAVSWFRESASEHIAMARELAAILKAHDIPVEMITSTRPGYVVYEDEFQVLAEPFRGEHPIAAG